MDEALKDLKKALEYAPEDKSIQLELQRVNQALAKARELVGPSESDLERFGDYIAI